MGKWGNNQLLIGVSNGIYRTVMWVLKILLYLLMPLGFLMLFFVWLVVAIIHDHKVYKQYGNKNDDERFLQVTQRTMDVLQDITGEDVGPFRTENSGYFGRMYADYSGICGRIILDKPLSNEFIEKLPLFEIADNQEKLCKYGVSRVNVYFLNRRELILMFNDSYGECGKASFRALLGSIAREDVENSVKDNNLDMTEISGVFCKEREPFRGFYKECEPK